MSSHRERNDRKAPFRGPRRGGDFRASAGDPSGWIWGWHAVEAALANPDREAPKKILATADRAAQLEKLHPRLGLEIFDNAQIAQRLPPGAAHQGVAMQTPALEGVSLEELGRSGRRLPHHAGSAHRSAKRRCDFSFSCSLWGAGGDSPGSTCAPVWAGRSPRRRRAP